MRPCARRRCHDTGVAVVEFALVLPLLLLFLLGIVTAGIAYNQKQELTHAAREGARYAATLPASQTFPSGTWATNVRDLIVERSDGELTAGQVCVSLVNGATATVVAPSANYSTSGSECIPGQAYPTSATDDGTRVQVVVTKPATIELGVFGSIAVTLTSKATSKSEAVA